MDSHASDLMDSVLWIAPRTLRRDYFFLALVGLAMSIYRNRKLRLRRLPMQKTKRARFRLAGRSVLVFVAFVLSLALVAPAVIAAEDYEITMIRNGVTTGC